MIERRADERAIRAKRNEAANAMLRGQPPEQGQERDAGGRFSAPPITGRGLDAGNRGGPASRKSGDWLGSKLRGENT